MIPNSFTIIAAKSGVATLNVVAVPASSANNANKFANILGPINAQLGNVSYALTAIVGGFLAINKVTFLGNALTLGGLVSFLTFNKNFSMPINQISQQVNAIVMALAGADRIFKLLDETPETDDLSLIHI